MAVIKIERTVMQIKNLASGLAVAAVTLVSFSSSAIGISKVMSPWQPKSSSEVEVPKIKTEANEQAETSVEVEKTEKSNSGSRQVAKVSGSSSNSVTTNSTVTLKPTAKPTSSAPAISPTQAPANPNQCLVTLFGIQYDVSPLRSTHGGGDIFVCNTDMTVTFQSQHMDIAIMAKYKVGAPAPTGGSTTGGSNGSSGSRHEDNDLDDDSREHEEENEREDERESDEAEDHDSDDRESSLTSQVILLS